MPKVIDLPTATTMDDGDYVLMEESTGGTKKITKANALSPIGLRYNATPPSGTTLSSTAMGTICSVTLPAGSYVVIGQLRWDKTSSDNYQYLLNISTSSSQMASMGYKQAMTGTGSIRTCDEVIAFLTLSAQTTVYLLARTFGSANESILVADTFLRAICVR